MIIQAIKWFQEHFHTSNEAKLVKVGKLREFCHERCGLDANSRKLMTSKYLFGKMIKKALPELKTSQIMIK